MAQEQERNDDEKDPQDEQQQDDETSDDAEHGSDDESKDDTDDSGDASADDDSDNDNSGDEDSDDDHSENADATPSLSAKEMTQAAIEALRDLTGREPEAATGLMWDGDAWLVTVDVLELARIPNTTDLIATYVVELDGDGNLSGYKRERRFQRGAAEEG
jgi:hypothetical protein